MIYSKTLFGDPFGSPFTDYMIMAIAVIIALILMVITTHMAVQHSTKQECLWDCITDVASIIIHLIVAFVWFYHGESWFPKNFLSENEFYLVFSVIVIMTVIAIIEFLVTLSNCLESMLRNGSVKVNN